MDMPMIRPPGAGSITRRHLLENLIEVPRHPCHHAVGVAGGHHGCGEGIAFLVDQSLNVALEIAVALQPAVEALDELGIVAGNPRIDHLEICFLRVEAGRRMFSATRSSRPTRIDLA